MHSMFIFGMYNHIWYIIGMDSSLASWLSTFPDRFQFCLAGFYPIITILQSIPQNRISTSWGRQIASELIICKKFSILFEKFLKMQKWCNSFQFDKFFVCFTSNFRAEMRLDFGIYIRVGTVQLPTLNSAREVFIFFRIKIKLGGWKNARGLARKKT